MRNWPYFRRFAVGGFLILGLLSASTAWAQQDLRALFGGSQAGGGSAETKIDVRLDPAAAKAGETVTLIVDVTLPEGSHTYSMSPGFSGRTKVELPTAEGLEAIDPDFTSSKKPTVKDDPLLGQKVETLKGHVSWTRKYRVTDLTVLKLAGVVKLQVCDANSCRPMQHKFALGASTVAASKFEMSYTQTLKSGETERPGPSTWTVRLRPEIAKPGDIVTLEVAAKLEKDHHTFALDQDPKNYGKPTTITLDSLNGLELRDKKATFKPDRKPEEHTQLEKVQRIYHDAVTFSQEFRVTAAAAKSGYGVAGLTSYQVCNSENCRPGKFDFSVGTVLPKKAAAQAVIGDGDQNDLAQLLDGLKYRDVGGETTGSLGLFLFYAFIGGMILNVMPCVLPVIAIKALGFIQQAGESRRRILALNASYSAGVISVFLMLATLAAFAGLSWGGLFQQVGFNIAMSVLVFAMGLNLLGVFEIGVPNVVGEAAGSQNKKGLSGAFLTGVFATILATPCSGPWLGVTLGWSVKQSPLIVYLVWSVMGFGMAFPFLVFGLFPRAIKLLPKPGNWMVTFKQLAGFFLLATAVYLLSLIEQSYLVPTLVTLLGVGFGLWMIGNLYDYSSPPRRRQIVRLCAVVSAAGISWYGFSLRDSNEKFHWEPFTPKAIAQALQEGRPVMVDFTADWCLTCKVVERATLNTDETKELVEKHGIVSLRADWTDGDEDIRSLLEKLGSTSIPVLAVFSPARPKEPVVLRDAWSQATLLSQLESAASDAKTAVKAPRIETPTVAAR